MSKKRYFCKDKNTLKGGIVTRIKFFIRRRLLFFSNAAHGEYRDTNPEYEVLKKYLFENINSSTTAADKKALKGDFDRISIDMRKAFDAYIRSL